MSIWIFKEDATFTEIFEATGFEGGKAEIRACDGKAEFVIRKPGKALILREEGGIFVGLEERNDWHS